MDLSGLTTQTSTNGRGNPRTVYFDDNGEVVAQTCSSCEIVKLAAEFAKHRGTKTGLNYKCRACVAVYAANRSKDKTPDSVKKAVTKYLKRNRKRLKREIKRTQREMHPDGTKICSNCKESKPLSSFGNATEHKDGLSYQCKDCTYL